MKFREKNDNGIILELTLKKRRLLYVSLWHSLTYGKNEKYIWNNTFNICEMLSVLDSPEFNKLEG